MKDTSRTRTQPSPPKEQVGQTTPSVQEAPAPSSDPTGGEQERKPPRGDGIPMR